MNLSNDLQPLDLCGLPNTDVSAETPLEVLLVLHCSDTPCVQSTAYSLTMNISPNCTRTLEFTPGAEMRIPTSTWRPTSVTVRLQQESKAVALQNVLIDKNTQTTTAVPETILLQHNNV